jgi:AGZA family xanthine/uracil permease-like MFS transporter
MIRQVRAVNWKFIGDALPTFVTIAAIPLTYSVAYGVISRLFVYMVLNGAIYIMNMVSRGAGIQPLDANLGKYWTWRVGELNPPWFVRVVEGGVEMESEMEI